VAVYREQDKKDYLKYYHKEVAAGRKPLAFGRWLGGSNSKKTISKPAAKKTPRYGETVRTKGISDQLRSSLTEDEIKKLKRQ
jgi:hypothetical protein